MTESRDSSRYEPVRSAVYLGWWEEPEFRTYPAVLRNLSHGGALVTVGASPVRDRPLYLCLASSPPGDWAEVEVVDAEPLFEDVHQVRLRFAGACPYELFNAAVLGLPTET
jgi:hypothetical protein